MLKLLAATALILGGLFALFLLTAPTNQEAMQNDFTEAKTTETKAQLEETADLENRPALIIGDPNANVTLVEYGDFKCPSCNQFHHGVGQRLRSEYIDSGQLKIEFRNFPFIGPDSGRAARATYCANDQGAFTAYHDNVYGYLWDTFYTQGDLNAEFRDVLTFEKLEELMADELADPELFASCIRSEENNKFIDADLLLGADDGITGTPGFVVAGQTITGPSNYNTFKTLIDIELGR